MRYVGRDFALAAGADLLTPLVALAQTASTPPQHWYEAIQVNGFAEASYGYNFNHPDSGPNTLRVFDFDARELKLGVAELVVQRPAASPGEIGFRFDAAVGQSVPKVTAASGLFRDSSTGEAHDYYLQQV